MHVKRAWDYILKLTIIKFNGYSEHPGGRHSDHPDRLETEQDYSDGIKTSIEELEQGNAELLEQNKYLQECNTQLQV